MTGTPSAFDAIKTALATHPRVQGVSTEVAGQSLRFKASSATRAWDLRLTLPGKQEVLPRIFLVDDPLIGSLAHVNYPGEVCVTDQEGLSIDPAQPAVIAQFYLDQALETLERSLAQHGAGDQCALVDEFEGYWFSLPNMRSVAMHLVADERLREIVAYIGTQQRCMAFSERQPISAHGYAALQRLKSQQRARALYIPLARPLQPPRPTELRDAQWLRARVFDHLAPAAREKLDELLRSWPKRPSAAYLLLSQPRAEGGRSAFALELAGRGSRHPLLDPSGGWQVRPLSVQRQAAADLRPRGGAHESLAHHRVAVVGCGAVGARVAEHLALSGVGHLTGVDPQLFESNNVYRHVLGGEAVGMPKVQALAQLLKMRLPEIGFQAEQTDLASWTSDLKALAGINAVVLATGAPHVERAFIRRLYAERGWRGPVISTWLEALGLGGHAQRTIPGLPGCLECLYTDRDGTSHLAPRVSFAAPGQALSHNLTGCVGSFTPYSAIDATQTAILATRLVMGALSGERTSTYDSWRGSDREFVAAGFSTAPWYQGFDEAHLRAAVEEYSRVPCPVCGGTR